MKTVRIRRDGEKYLAYFIETKKLMGVNETGAVILELLFNQSMNADAIISRISEEYDAHPAEISEDVRMFLDHVRFELDPEIYNDAEQRQLIRPMGAEIRITDACNLKCRHCFQKYHSSYEMPTRDVIATLDAIIEEGVYEIALIGGEPMCHSGIADVLAFCEGHDVSYSMVTNGTLINRSFIKAANFLPRLSVMISMEGLGDIHESIRGTGTFNKVDNAIRSLVDAGVGVEVLCTLNAENVGHFREVADYCRKIGIVCDFNLFKQFWPEQKNLMLKPEKFFSTVVELIRMRQDEGYKIGISNAAIVGDILGMPPRNECRATRSGFSINVNGRMVTCPLLETAGYYNPDELPMVGNGFLDAWLNDPAFLSFRNAGFRECQARAYIFSGSVNGHDPYGVTAFRIFMSSRKS